MIDIHCHLIPGIDDGAKNIEQALELIQVAVDDGIKRIVITPHLHLGRYENFSSLIKFKLLRLNNAVIKAGIDVQIRSAAEVRFDFDILDLIASLQVPMYGIYEGHRYMLLELPHSHIPTGCTELIKYLLKQNIKPVIAHPERNKELLKNPEKIVQLTRLGCWFQLTAGSIVGLFGEKCQELSIHYLEQGLINVVASDAHNTKYRPPVLSAARQYVADLIGEDEAHNLFWQNPYNITATLFE